MSPQFLLEGRSLDELTREATELYGADARIVRAERVLDTGVAGFLGRRHLEVTVEVPVPSRAEMFPARAVGATARGPVHAAIPAPHALSDRAGILALLDTADSDEDDVNADLVDRASPLQVTPLLVTPLLVTPDLSTESTELTELLARLGEDRAGRSVPVPLSAPGDLVLVVGLGDAARQVTASMVAGADAASGTGWAVYGAGPTEPSPRPWLGGRWDAVRARALAVEVREAVLVACDLGSITAGLPHLDGAASLGADQVWVVVDARHKPDDTRAWVDRVRSLTDVDALAVVGAGESLSPHTVNGLRIPVGWVDGSPAPRTVL